MASSKFEKFKQKYENYSNFEKTLGLLLIFVGLIAFILFVILLNDKHHSENLCTTPACLAAASHIMHTVDPTLDPCEDFYKFSCGTFMKNTFYRSQPSLMHELRELKTNQVHQMVALDVEDEDKLPKSYRYVRKCDAQQVFYTSEVTGENLCTTPACLVAPSHIMHTVDTTLDPCEDFYKFSCGTFMKHTFYRWSQPSLMHELRELKTNQVHQMVALDVEDKDKLPKSYQYVRKCDAQQVFYTSEVTGENLCTTPACLAAASHIMHTVDPTLDPCEDFYKFSCGTFMKNTFYRWLQPSLMHELRELKTNQVHQMVALDVENEDKLPKSYQYVRKFYRKCFNSTEIDADQDKTFLEGLDQLMGGWPLANGFAMPFDWPEVMVKAIQLGMKWDFFLDIDYEIADNESEIYIEIMPPDNYNKDEWHEDKVEHFVKIATLLGRTVPGARVEMLKTMEFAKKLDHISEKCKNETKNSTMEDRKMTIGELQKSMNYVPIQSWLSFLKDMTNINNLTDHTVVIVSVTQEYFRELQLLMSHTENKWRANYVAGLLLIYEGQFLSSKIRKIVSTISPPYTYYRPKDRSKFCASSAINCFHGALQGAFIRKVVTPEKRKDILEMLNSIRHNLEISVNKTNWIDQESKDSLTKFLKNMTISIGWTDMVFDVEKYEKYLVMDKLNLDFDKPILEIFHSLSKVRQSEKFRVIGHYSDKFDLEINDVRLDVNAYYMKLMNQLFLIAPLLQSPMYDIDRPKYMNYGSLGSIIGHELTHGATHSHAVDEEIKRYSKEDYEKVWTNQTKENFVNATQCVVDEYDEYESQSKFNHSLSGNETLEENVADFTAINIAYEAYQTWVRKHGYEKRLPGVKFTPNQLFWIMSATYVCTNEQLMEEAYSCKDNKHGEPSFRTNGPIKNSPYFARDFKCPLGSNMNPKNKCRVYF